MFLRFLNKTIRLLKSLHRQHLVKSPLFLLNLVLSLRNDVNMGAFYTYTLCMYIVYTRAFYTCAVCMYIRVHSTRAQCACIYACILHVHSVHVYTRAFYTCTVCKYIRAFYTCTVCMYIRVPSTRAQCACIYACILHVRSVHVYTRAFYTCADTHTASKYVHSTRAQTHTQQASTCILHVRRHIHT